MIVFRPVRPFGQMWSCRSRLYLHLPLQLQFHQQNFLVPDGLQFIDYFGYPHLRFGHLPSARVLSSSICHPGKVSNLLCFANARRCQQSQDHLGFSAHPHLFSVAMPKCRADEVFHWIFSFYSFFDNLNYNR